MGNGHQICGLVLPVSLQERLSSSSNEEKLFRNNILVYAFHAALLHQLSGQSLGTEAELPLPLGRKTRYQMTSDNPEEVGIN